MRGEGLERRKEELLLDRTGLERGRRVDGQLTEEKGGGEEQKEATTLDCCWTEEEEGRGFAKVFY